MKRDSVVFEKSRAFALRVIKLYNYMKSEHSEYVLSKQLLRSGTSIGANIAEVEYLTKQEYDSIIFDCEEILKLLTSITKTTTKNVNN